jgi:O-acetylhomoserine/O-acetylserine sulfhydrylase-like pyridoxal-dependent enzyme
VKLFSHLANISNTRSLIIPSGLDHAPPALRRTEGVGRRRPRTLFGSRSGWKAPTDIIGDLDQALQAA